MRDDAVLRRALPLGRGLGRRDDAVLRHALPLGRGLGRGGQGRMIDIEDR